MFKCLIFIQGLTAPKDAGIRSLFLTKLKQNRKITLQNLEGKCQCISNLRADTVKIEEQDIFMQSRISQKVGKKTPPFLKLIPTLVVANYIYLKIVLLRTKSVKIVGTKDINKKMDERKNTNGKHYNSDEKIYFKNNKFGKAI